LFGASLTESALHLRDGTPVLIRQLLPEDSVIYHDFLGDVTAEDLRLRFFASMHSLSENQIERLLHYDPTRATAFIAISERTGKMLGVVRLHDDKSRERAEFAVLVRSALKGEGVGWLLMQHMIAFAKRKGLRIIEGQVLSGNTTMLAMCAEFGFHIMDDPSSPGVKTVSLPIYIELPT
jgi:acetyltransferase